MIQDYGEVFCEAVDTIIKQRVGSISYDQTILCEIVDDAQRDNGVYTATSNNGLNKFTAYSENTSYRKGDNVYIQIPQGDWNQQKFIVSKKLEDVNSSITYKRPFNYLVDITGNLVDNVGAVSLIANDPEVESKTIWSTTLSNGMLAGYTRLGIRADFRSWINPFYDENNQPHYVSQGDYGLRLIAKVDEQQVAEPTGETAKRQFEYEFTLGCADMNGNPYDFQSYYQQERVFDISSFGTINELRLEFYQKAGSFGDGTADVPYLDFLGNKVAPNLFANEIYVGLGYDVNEFDTEMVQVYTLDSLSFSRQVADKSKNHKKVQMRWIHKLDDGTFTSITEKDKLDYTVYWYRYELGHASADKYSDVYWKYLAVQSCRNGEITYEIKDVDWLAYNERADYQNRREIDFFTSWLLPNTSEATEKVKAVVVFGDQIIRSNVLTCTNDLGSNSMEVLDGLYGLNVVCRDGTYGNYYVYKPGGALLDNSMAHEPRVFKPYFKSVEDTSLEEASEVIEGESIEWIIPTTNTMIRIDDADLGGAFIIAEDGATILDEQGSVIGKIDREQEGRISVIRYCDANGSLANRNGQTYYIKSYYNQTYNNNTIQCKLVKDGITYIATKELTFGQSGTTGTDSTFVLDFDNGKTVISLDSNEAITITARLYDFENKEVDLSTRVKDITWSWSDENYAGPLSISVLSDKPSCEIKFNSTLTEVPIHYSILKAKLVGWGDYELIAYLPIPISVSSKYAYISGTTTVLYNSAGELTEYFKNPYQLFTKGLIGEVQEDGTVIATDNLSYQSVALDGVSWEVDDSDAYKPKMSKDDDVGYWLKPLSFYVKDSCDKVCVVAKKDNVVLWTQPIYITLNHYPSTTLNEWGGDLVIDETSGTILAPRIAAGKKINNAFSGVVMGDWEAPGNDGSLNRTTGLYGYYKGEQSFAFKEDGNAFIGRSGAGRIEFDGDQAIIKSSGYSVNKGMQLDLTNGKIDAHQFTLKAGKKMPDMIGSAGTDNTIYLSTEAEKYPLRIGSNFKVEWDGSITATNGSFSGNIYADSGYFGGELQAATGTFKGTLKAATGTFAGELKIGKISGNNYHFVVDSDGNLTIQNSKTSKNFQVSNEGSIIMSGESLTLQGGYIQVISSELDEETGKYPVFGQIGIGQGYDGKSVTEGLVLLADSTHYVIATESGVRLQADDCKIAVADKAYGGTSALSTETGQVAVINSTHNTTGNKVGLYVYSDGVYYCHSAGANLQLVGSSGGTSGTAEAVFG